MVGLDYELTEGAAVGNPVRVGLIGAGQMSTDMVTTKMTKDIQVVITTGIDIERRLIHSEQLITHTFLLADIDAPFEMAASGNGMKVVITGG
jgi:predicted homoserine dehydrogenase-like protein